MKLSNLFKKETVANPTFEKLEKTQLEKVVGGIDTMLIESTDSAKTTPISKPIQKPWMPAN